MKQQQYTSGSNSPIGRWIHMCSLWSSPISMENDPFLDDLRLTHGYCMLLLFSIFSIAVSCQIARKSPAKRMLFRYLPSTFQQNPHVRLIQMFDPLGSHGGQFLTGRCEFVRTSRRLFQCPQFTHDSPEKIRTKITENSAIWGWYPVSNRVTVRLLYYPSHPLKPQPRTWWCDLRVTPHWRSESAGLPACFVDVLVIHV